MLHEEYIKIDPSKPTKSFVKVKVTEVTASDSYLNPMKKDRFEYTNIILA